MPKIILASALSRWLQNADAASPGETAFDVSGSTLIDALEQLFAARPKLRGYVVDERGAVRHHVAIFVDGVAIHDKERPHAPVTPNTEIYIMQALSGG